MLVAGAVTVVATTVAFAATGDLTQPAGTAGCISETGADTCADGHSLDGVWAVDVSPDGKNVYAATNVSNSVAILQRNMTNGILTQSPGPMGCVSEDGVGTCMSGRGLGVANAVAVSPDGKNVYVASYGGDAVARFNRDTTTGALTQPAGTAGCISETGADGCADGHALGGLYGIAVSPDGKSVYVTSTQSDSLARLNRNTTTGALTQPAGSAGCINNTGASGCADGHALDNVYSVGVSPDSETVYVTAQASRAVARLDRNTTTGALTQPAGTAGCISETGAGPCADGHALQGPTEVAVSPNGKNVYVASYFSYAVLRLNRSTTTGAITQPPGTAGCVSEDGSGPCANGHGLVGPAGVVVSPDSKSVYAAAFDGSAIARFNRNTISGAISQPVGIAGCISETGAGPCADGHGLYRPKGIAISPDGKHIYVGSFSSDSVARLTRAP